jgi:predicted  nucleic acid-binding Zn-ribbon protein
MEKIAVQSDKNRAELRQEVRDIETKLDKSNSANQKALDKGKNNSKKVVSLEIENEDLQNEIRRNQFIIEDLQLKFDT